MDENQTSREILLAPELIKDLTVTAGKQGWKPEELQLKKREIRYTLLSIAVGTITAFATTIAAIAAAVAVVFAAKGVNVAQTAIATKGNVSFKTVIPSRV
ncbi:MAG: hypothetical protein ACRDRS_23385 [Pseudonocardiaceae bacterium]